MFGWGFIISRQKMFQSHSVFTLRALKLYIVFVNRSARHFDSPVKRWCILQAVPHLKALFLFNFLWLKWLSVIALFRRSFRMIWVLFSFIVFLGGGTVWKSSGTLIFLFPSRLFRGTGLRFPLGAGTYPVVFGAEQ